MVARGARGAKGRQRRLLQPFTPLLLSYMGRGELHTLTSVEESGTSRRLLGERLACGLYLNELLIYLLPRAEAVEELFAFYNLALEGLAGDEPVGPLLRCFELQLLESMGVAPAWGRESSSGEEVLLEEQYGLCADGPVYPSLLSGRVGLVTGEALLALASGEPSLPAVLPQTKRVLRYFINLHLGGRKLRSRELLRAPVAPVGAEERV